MGPWGSHEGGALVLACGAGLRGTVAVFLDLCSCTCIAFVITTESQHHLLITEERNHLRTGPHRGQKSMWGGTSWGPRAEGLRWAEGLRKEE